MILITGANGQLGYDLQRILKSENREFLATDYTELDITNIDAVRAFVKDKEIELIINCAAYNNVDKAEEEVDM
ncbi:MAG: sugar nucleotide-binding protein, partial [Cetobacterium sp.]